MNTACYPVTIVFYGHRFFSGDYSLWTGRTPAISHCVPVVMLSPLHGREEWQLPTWNRRRFCLAAWALMLASVILGRMSCHRVSRFVEGCGASIDILLSCHTGGNVGIFRRLSTGRYHWPVDFNYSVVSYNTSLKKENLCSWSSVHTPQSIPPSPGSPGKLATISFGRGRAVEWTWFDHVLQVSASRCYYILLTQPCWQIHSIF